MCCDMHIYLVKMYYNISTIIKLFFILILSIYAKCNSEYKNIILKYYYLHHTYNYFHSIILNDYCIHIFYYAYYIYKSTVFNILCMIFRMDK